MLFLDGHFWTPTSWHPDQPPKLWNDTLLRSFLPARQQLPANPAGRLSRECDGPYVGLFNLWQLILEITITRWFKWFKIYQLNPFSSIWWSQSDIAMRQIWIHHVVYLKHSVLTDDTTSQGHWWSNRRARAPCKRWRQGWRFLTG